ncbi:hypothetical protein [Crocosphaera sp. XPORK-15E]|uniref:hypothetical protein n=1 Tax=Crocosphaera sp. XPORK-15E TaxID=3110247 RepID=UPI002B1E9715|nr:hypothetical protein [Crocosphaera sp. XPORK-15E]MEA5532606.1 hypothetical protein [Crocosphaera sp. XPORK-15E]
MSTVTDNDLRELKDLINNRFDDLSNELKTVDKKIDIYIAKTDEKLNSIKQNLDDLKKQSEKQDKWSDIIKRIQLVGWALPTIISRSAF